MSLENSGAASGEQSARICIIHYKHTCTYSTVKPLTECTFARIQTVADKRSHHVNPLHRLDHICNQIPSTFDSDHHGAHEKCYWTFTDISQLETVEQLTSADHQTATSTFPRTCLFCGLFAKVVHGKTFKLSKCRTNHAVEVIKESALQKKASRS